MKFLEKYWWVLLLIVLGVVGYFWYMKSKKKKEEESAKKNGKPSCTTVSMDKWNQEVNKIMDTIDNTPEWKTYVENSKKDGETYDDAKRRNAEYSAQNDLNICKPAA